MPADVRPAFGRRNPGPGPQPSRPAPAPRAAKGVELSAEAQALAAQIAAEKALGGDADAAELKDWKKAHRDRMWSAAGQWKYLAAILGVLSFAGRLHDFGPHSETAALVVRGLASACGVMAFWRGFGVKRK